MVPALQMPAVPCQSTVLSVHTHPTTMVVVAPHHCPPCCWRSAPNDPQGPVWKHPLDKYGPKPREDAKSTLLILPTREFITYLVGSSLCVAPWTYYSINKYPVSSNNALVLSSLLGCGPVVLSIIISRIYNTTNSTHPIKMSPLANLLHLFFGMLFCGIPLTYGCWLTIS